MHNKSKIFITVGILLFLIGLFFTIESSFSRNKVSSKQTSVELNRKKHRNTFILYKDPKDLEPAGTWNKKGEKKLHPDLNHVKDLWVRVSLKGNRTYIMSGKKPIYTMLSTGGLYHNGKSYTPTGTYYVQEERGQKFYNEKLKEGARNYVSWKDHGIYLFHSVPTKYGDKIDVKEANKLGKTQGSHGCVRLSLPDSKWLMETLPVGTKVVIKDN